MASLATVGEVDLELAGALLYIDPDLTTAAEVEREFVTGFNIALRPITEAEELLLLDTVLR